MDNGYGDVKPRSRDDNFSIITKYMVYKGLRCLYVESKEK